MGILRDRSTIYKEPTKSSRILGPDLIEKDPDLRPFWNPYQGDIETVVVMHRDRLARFGVELIEWILRKNGTQLLVQSHPNETEGNDRGEEAELVDDMLSIVNVFVARNNGRRSAANRKGRSQSSKAGEGRGKEYSRYDEVSIVCHS